MVISTLILLSFIGGQLLKYRAYVQRVLHQNRRLKWGGVTGILVGVILCMIAVGSPGERFRGIGGEISFRAQVCSDTVSMWRDNPVWGTGPGSFAAVFPYYQSMPSEMFTLLHAHCEPLEFLAEWGVLGAVIFLAGVAWILLSTPPNEAAVVQKPSWSRVEGVGLWMALAGIGLHGLIDFPFSHPLIALMTVMLIGILAGQKSKNLFESEWDKNGRTEKI